MNKPHPQAAAELPAPFDYVYVWNGGFGSRRSLSAAPYNGVNCTDGVPVYTADQMRDYASAAVAAIAAPKLPTLSDAQIAAAWKAWPHQSITSATKAISFVRAALAASAQQRVPAWRPEVIAFANAMERKLRENEWKGTWKHDAPGSLMDRVHEELMEFRDELYTIGPRDTEAHRTALLNEAADVANMLMMVVDVCGALAASPSAPSEAADSNT